MRDQKKNKNYWEKYFEDRNPYFQSSVERILDKNISPEMRFRSANMAIPDIMERRMAKYSMGLSVKDCYMEDFDALVISLEEMVYFLNEFPEEFKRLTFKGLGPHETLREISAAFLSIDNHKDREYICNLINKLLYTNEVINSFLLKMNLPIIDNRYIDSDDNVESDILLLKLVSSEISSKEKIPYLEKFISGWKKRLRSDAPHILIPESNPYGNYAGHWCLEGAAISVIFGIDDSGFNRYAWYPVDWANYGRSLLEK